MYKYTKNNPYSALNIYFEDRFISISPSGDHTDTGDPNAVTYFPGENLPPEDIPALFETNIHIHRLVIRAKDAQEQKMLFDRMFSTLERVEAGGGLVVNERGEYLMILRNGRWDLPKGKQEEGEDIRSTALREVTEECGISRIEITTHICNTCHTYRREGHLLLKCTQWYGMRYTGDGTDVTPQRDENIEQAVWVNAEKLQECLQNSYHSIREVFRSIGT